MCSKRSERIVASIGSKIKSIPSRLANFAAGTKSLSPAIKIIWFTCFLYAKEAISSPMRISTPFWEKEIEKSDSVKSSMVISLWQRALILSAFNEKWALASERTPILSASFRFFFNSSKKDMVQLYVSERPKSTPRFSAGWYTVFLRGGQS